jgi:hypothetical protein
MPRYGLYRDGITSPLQEIEGDYTKREGDIVTVCKRNPNPSLGNVRDPEVGYFRLDKGQTVREVK